jgi:glutathione synthase/RimK-type ligase-like ATP-grasp enzyme
MENLVVVTQIGDWPHIEGVRMVTARSYLTDPEFKSKRRVKVFNLCRHYRYQAYGYYVSLLAEARGHKPIPTVMTIGDLRSPALVRIASDEIDELTRKTLVNTPDQQLTFNIYFGREISGAYDRLALALFKLFPAPLLRATFVRSPEWELQNITAISASAIPHDDKDFAAESARTFFAGRQPRPSQRTPQRFDLAILHDPKDPTSPSDRRAIERFVEAAEDIGIAAEIINREDLGRLLEFDALFIRTTTAVNHYTYRFARRAAAEGLLVIDDPLSILRCTNKVYLAELLALNQIPTPRTLIVAKDSIEAAAREIGFPCILKKPDSSSSLGVIKADDESSLRDNANALFESSDLLIAQEFMPTPFDWRIAILDRRPLFAAKYFMAAKHWQIIRHGQGRTDYGRFEILPTEDVPQEGLKLALKAANLIGDGLYGVDLKQVGAQWYVIEINDNPNIDSRVEDRYLKDELYRRVMAVFLRRLEDRAEGRANR